MLLPSLLFVFLALHWLAASAVAVGYFRWHTRVSGGDYLVASAGVVLAFFYLWVAREVYNRRARVWNTAVGCAAFWLVGFPTGTIASLVILSALVGSKHSFSK